METRPVAAGAKTLLETASTNVQAYSCAEVARNGTTAIEIAIPTVPAVTRARSPVRRTIFPKKYPCTDAAVIPDDREQDRQLAFSPAQHGCRAQRQRNGVPGKADRDQRPDGHQRAQPWPRDRLSDVSQVEHWTAYA